MGAVDWNVIGIVGGVVLVAALAAAAARVMGRSFVPGAAPRSSARVLRNGLPVVGVATGMILLLQARVGDWRVILTALNSIVLGAITLLVFRMHRDDSG